MPTEEQFEVALEALGREPPDEAWLIRYSCDAPHSWETLVGALFDTDSDRAVADLIHGLCFTSPASLARRSADLERISIRIAKMPEGTYKEVAMTRLKELELATDRREDCEMRSLEMIPAPR